ncbi:uncharacterized protein LOC111815351 [Octodon degus]|uniref:Uncharacterized protein LOC111815351 n=1 Tax=Octodon degus TaxID=10160 RepID=A0A6P6E004_OCTDE|nr:uncharacterized protein LOC111815351 [Octodon degus]
MGSKPKGGNHPSHGAQPIYASESAAPGPNLLHSPGLKGCLLHTPVGPALNPATLLPDDDPEMPFHNCSEILEANASLREDLTDVPLDNPEATLYTDGSSFVQDGVPYAGAAVVTEDQVIWAQALGHGTLAQRAELIALTQALCWGRGKQVNVYTDSRYAFATLHVHGTIYQERGLLTTGGHKIKNAQEILDLLAAVWLPKRVAVIHCKGHQKVDSPVAPGKCSGSCHGQGSGTKTSGATRGTLAGPAA